MRTSKFPKIYPFLDRSKKTPRTRRSTVCHFLRGKKRIYKLQPTCPDSETNSSLTHTHTHPWILWKFCRPDYETGLQDFKERLMNYEKVSTIYTVNSKILEFCELFSIEWSSIPFIGLWASGGRFLHQNDWHGKGAGWSVTGMLFHAFAYSTAHINPRNFLHP